jgi:hypothetical protein
LDARRLVPRKQNEGHINKFAGGEHQQRVALPALHKTNHKAEDDRTENAKATL